MVGIVMVRIRTAVIFGFNQNGKIWEILVALCGAKCRVPTNCIQLVSRQVLVLSRYNRLDL